MLEQVFEMFTPVDRQLRRSKEGLGIGLHLVRTLVTMHSGSVTAQSEGVGLGSEFRVRLPLADDASLSASPASGIGSASDVAPMQRILVVDDNRDAADSLGMLFRYLNLDVHVIYDGRSTLESLRMFKPSLRNKRGKAKHGLQPTS